MERIGVERRTRGDLEIKGLVVSIEAVGRQGRTKQTDLYVEITVDGRISLQTMNWCKQHLKVILTEGLLLVFGV